MTVLLSIVGVLLVFAVLWVFNQITAWFRVWRHHAPWDWRVLVSLDYYRAWLKRTGQLGERTDACDEMRHFGRTIWRCVLIQGHEAPHQWKVD